MIKTSNFGWVMLLCGLCALSACEGTSGSTTPGNADAAVSGVADVVAPISSDASAAVDGASAADLGGVGITDVAAPDGMESTDTAAAEDLGSGSLDAIADATGPGTAPSYVFPEGMVGEAVLNPVPLPELIAVVDSTGSAVTQDDFLGHWTTVWFYPFANTTG